MGTVCKFQFLRQCFVQQGRYYLKQQSFEEKGGSGSRVYEKLSQLCKTGIYIFHFNKSLLLWYKIDIFSDRNRAVIDIVIKKGRLSYVISWSWRGGEGNTAGTFSDSVDDSVEADRISQAFFHQQGCIADIEKELPGC